MFTLRVRNRLHPSRRNLAIAGVTALLSTAVSGILPAQAVGGVTAGSTITFSPTGAEQSFVVPAGATMMRVTLAGAPGNDTYPGFSAGNTAVGGLGSLVTADIPAPVAGSTVYAEAGGLSTWGGNATGVGGFNGGGNGRPGSGGGGGATDLRTVSNVTGGTLTSRLAVAAGGGGAGTGGADVNNICYFNGCPPGNGGSAQAASANGGAGQDGPNTRGTASYHFGGYPGVAGGQGGAGGSQTAGGAGGQQQNPNNNCDIQSIPFGGVGGSPGAPGTLGIGGQGSTTQTGCSLGQGGGGGGGYYGGGGADGGNGLGTTSGPYASGGGGGGGAGSSYVASSAVTSAFAVDSTKTPRISITFNPTTTSVACSPASIAVNSPTTCTATVASVDTSDVVAATGTVSLTRTAGAGTLGATSCSLDATGSCSVPYTPDLGSTAHTIAAAYPGDDAHAASSGSGNLTSTRRTTATTAACVPTTSPVNSSVTCTATVGDSDAGTTSLPAGTVSWTTAGWGTFSPTSCTVAAGQCSVAFTPSPGHEGNAVIAPAYGGDANHLSSSGAATVPATRRASTATATCTPNDAPVNAATTCTASVHDSTGGTAVTPGGSVSWTVSSGPGSVTPSSCTLASASCSVTYTPAPGSEGLHSLALTYVGDTDHTGSNGDAGLTAVTRTTSAAASCSPVTVAVSAPTTCTATVSDTSAGTTMQPTGAVSWTVGSGSGDLSQPTCNLASGACSVTYTPAPGSSGPHSLHAVYAGDDDHSGSVDNAALTAGRRSTATTAGCSATSATVNATVSCVATVTDTAAGSTSAPTGVATWSLQSGKGTFSPTTCQVLVGFCFTTFTPDPGSVGPDTIRATYGADTDHAGSTGQYVFAINARSTTSSVACSPTTVQVNQATTCTATVTDSDAATPITPTGIVDWTAPGASGALSAPSCTLSSSTCSVTFTPTAGSEGANPLVTAYTGDGDHSGSGSGASVTASQRAATVAASCAPNTQVMNSATTCTAMVTDTDAATAVTATGTIAWTVTSGSGDLSTPSCSLAAGVCSVTYTPAIGSPTAHSLEASYNGDADHAAGTAPAAVTVERRAATVTATCSPASTVVNSATECSAVVADASPSTTVEPDGTVAWTVSDGAGALDTTSCTLVSGSCSVNYTPAPGSAGDQTLHASYSGDTAHQAVAQDAAVTALRRSVFLTELCTGITGHITVPVSCIASVRDSDAGTPVAPTGRVSWSLQGGGGSFSTTSCTLSSGQCAVQYRPDAGTAGAQTVEAHYVGDGSHVSGVTTFDYSVTVVPVTMDAYGHLRGSDGVSLTTSRAPVWATKLARGQALISGQTGGYTLDAYGGVHAWGSATRVVTTAHWSGWDIARDIALNPCDSSQKSGYVLDGYGALHAFGHAPSVRMSAYFSGRDIAKAFALNPCSDGVVSGYVLDGFGSLHSFSSGAAITSPASAHWRGWNIARGVIVIRAGAGYTLDGFGALHAFGGAPALRRAPAYFGWDIARDVVALSEGGGYTVDGFGGLHAFGTAHSVPGSGYTRGNDIYRFVGIG